LIKIIIKEENFKWHLEAFASELFIYTLLILQIYSYTALNRSEFAICCFVRFSSCKTLWKTVPVGEVVTGIDSAIRFWIWLQIHICIYTGDVTHIQCQ